MDILTNCPNCGAPVDLAATSCAYCDTPYTWRAAAAPAPADGLDACQVEKITRALAAGIMTQNQARAMLGLPPV